MKRSRAAQAPIPTGRNLLFCRPLMSTFGVLVLSLKGMKHLAQCLDSVKWADSVLVLHVDDHTPDIGPSSSSSVAIRKASSMEDLWPLAQEIKTDWVLHLWGEERVEAPLKEQLDALCRENLSQAAAAYQIPIRSQLLGRWVDGSLRDESPALRLCRATRSFSFERWGGSTQDNRRRTGLLEGWIADYSLSDLTDGMEQIQAVSNLWADYLRNQGRVLGPLAIVNRSFRVFIQLLLKNRALSKGLAGLTLALLAAYVVLLGGAKCWETKYISGKKAPKGYA